MEQVAEPATLLPWFSLVVPIIAAAVTGYFSYRIGSRKEAGSTTAALHGGFRILIDELQAERDRLSTQLAKAIDEGNVDLKREMHERFTELEGRIEHNRRNADHNFQIINEIVAQQIEDMQSAIPSSKRRPRIVPQRLGKGPERK